MAKALPSRTAILDVLGSEDRPFHAKEISTRLGVDQASYSALLRQLDDLAFDGLATARDGHKFKLSKRSAEARGEEREGIISLHPRGFGVVATLAAARDD